MLILNTLLFFQIFDRFMICYKNKIKIEALSYSLCLLEMRSSFKNQVFSKSDKLSHTLLLCKTDGFYFSSSLSIVIYSYNEKIWKMG